MSEAAQRLAASAGGARPGNGRFFANQTFHFEALRALGYMQAGGAEAGKFWKRWGSSLKGMSGVGTLRGQRPQTAIGEPSPFSGI
jgi:hypothetical protein